MITLFMYTCSLSQLRQLRGQLHTAWMFSPNDRADVLYRMYRNVNLVHGHRYVMSTF